MIVEIILKYTNVVQMLDKYRHLKTLKYRNYK